MKTLIQVVFCFALTPAFAQTVTVPACTTPQQILVVNKNGVVIIPAHTCPAYTFTVPKGATGNTGATGAAGAIGKTGSVGLQGPQGIPGVAGPAGPQGVAGVQGIPGQVGPAGPQGVPGTAAGTYTISCNFTTANVTVVNGIVTYSNVVCSLTPVVGP